MAARAAAEQEADRQADRRLTPSSAARSGQAVQHVSDTVMLAKFADWGEHVKS